MQDGETVTDKVSECKKVREREIETEHEREELNVDERKPAKSKKPYWLFTVVNSTLM